MLCGYCGIVVDWLGLCWIETCCACGGKEKDGVEGPGRKSFLSIGGDSLGCNLGYLGVEREWRRMVEGSIYYVDTYS